MDGNNMNMENQTVDTTYTAEGTYEAVEKKGNALAIISLITGILSIVCCCMPIVSVLPGIAAIICGVLGIKKCEKVGMAKAGMILGIVGVVLVVISLIFSLVTGGISMMDYMESSSYYY